jgi:hypothetical protein
MPVIATSRHLRWQPAHSRDSCCLEGAGSQTPPQVQPHVVRPLGWRNGRTVANRTAAVPPEVGPEIGGGQLVERASQHDGRGLPRSVRLFGHQAP